MKQILVLLMLITSVPQEVQRWRDFRYAKNKGPMKDK